MAIYENFADVYDIFMEDVPYEDWTLYIQDIFKKFNLEFKSNIIAELGCGTGEMTISLKNKGYDMIGIDISQEMLNIAKQKALNQNLDILFLEQDMTAFELFGTVDSVVSVCDSLNYILEDDELLEVFKLVNNYLEPNGLFVFDLNTEYKFKNVLANNTFSDAQEDCAYTLENFYDDETQINEFYTNFFIKYSDDNNDSNNNLYQRFEEFHYEKAYSINKIKELLSEAGLEFLAVYDELTFEPPKEDSQRIFFVAREINKIK